MYVEMDKQEQANLVQDAVDKAGGERRLEKITGISHMCIHSYKKVKHRMPYARFKIFLDFLGLNESDFQFKLIDPHDFHSKGGRMVYEKYVRENRFESIHKGMRAASSRFMKEWHSTMKKENASAYYALQHSRFKSVGKKKWKTKRGELVRNEFECQVADLLFDLCVDYDYEPHIELSRTYFPDFKIGNLLLECTAWKGVQKAASLSTKIKAFEDAGYEIRVVIPDRLRSFYKSIENHIISPNGLKYLF